MSGVVGAEGGARGTDTAGGSGWRESSSSTAVGRWHLAIVK